MHHRNGRAEIFLLQVTVKAPELADEKHPFVDDRSAREADDISVIVRLFKFPSHHIQPPVKRQAACHVVRLLYKALEDSRHAVSGCFPQDLRMNGHFTPAKELHSFLFRNNFKHLLRLSAVQCVMRKEKHADPVISGIRQADVFLFDRLFEEGMADLGENPDAVPDLPGCILPGAVLQLFNDFQGVVHDVTALSPFDVNDNSDSAGIPFFHFSVGKPFLFIHFLSLLFRRTSMPLQQSL